MKLFLALFLFVSTCIILCSSARCNSSCAVYPTCDNGTCLSEADVCNGFADCEQAEDERYCGYGTCGRSGLDGNPDEPAQIVGGEESATGAWPWQVMITRYTPRIRAQTPQTFNKHHLTGGGSLINNKWVLTAAHLFDVRGKIKPEDTVVTLGLSKRPSRRSGVGRSAQMFLAGEVIPHPSFNQTTALNDIALIRLGARLNPNTMKPSDRTGGVSYSYHVRPVCLPCTGTCLTRDLIVDSLGNSLLFDGISEELKCSAEETVLHEAGSEVVVSGFGYTNKQDPSNSQQRRRLGQRLKHAKLRTTSDYECNFAHTEMNQIAGGSGLYNDTLLCAKSTNRKKVSDSCQRDSGGPLVRKITNAKTGVSCWIQVGIVSYGYGCALHLPGFYTKVSKYIPWIKATMNEIEY